MIKALSLTGPTASGKTAISIELARRFGCEIICCDSMQIYRYMDIGTAKATPEERAAVPHYMLDFLSPDEKYSAQRYREQALLVAEDITSRGKIPLFVGGTGLYIDTVIRPSASATPESSPELRARLMEQASTELGREMLYERLTKVDPESAALTHKNNVKRVVRALEIFETTGRPKSLLDKKCAGLAEDISVGMITIDFHDRANLYERVDLRVDQMMDEGLVEEARALSERGYLSGDGTALQAIGYKELLPYLRGEEELSSAAERIKLKTRQYAKRQLTWFRHEPDALRLYPDTESGIMKDKDALMDEASELCSRIIRKMDIIKERQS